ncbi:hypothetical protein DL768_004827 [Monosporascus sp. mg162]|nr:hypothetical protein DL768_004827 [Monosporascus sp. mg162]
MEPLSMIGAIALGVCALGVSADSNSTSKRGISFIPETPPADYDILLSSESSPITWYYTWSPRPAPEDHIFPWGARSGIEFVPTLHSIGDGRLERDIEELGSLTDSSKHLFTFNEPDGTTDSGGSAITPREAAEAYIEQIVPLRERFRISHPSVTGSERGLGWLREFDSACREIDPENGCPTDFVVAHWYGGLEGLIWWLENLVDLYVSGNYGFESENDLEIWIKELGIPGAPAEANQEMMEQTLPYLDGLNYVNKYAWFGTFRPQQANEWTGEGVALFQDDGGLTAIGALYLGGEANGFQVGDRGRDSPQPPEEDDDNNDESVGARAMTGILGTWILTILAGIKEMAQTWQGEFGKVKDARWLPTWFDCRVFNTITIVVAVHGLNFRGSVNHVRETWTKGGKLWLKDLLPAHLPKPARVMLFAYNSSPAIGAAAIKLDDHAKTLLQWLWLKRNALVEATLDEKYRSIVEATCLLVFFATPHKGGNYASVGDIAAKIVTLGKPNNYLLDALKQSSNEVTRRFEQARHLFERCLVVSFFEGEQYGKMGIIVDKGSATLNLPGTREVQVAIHANHSTICKFDPIDSSTCELVLGTIAAETGRALGITQNILGFDHSSFNEEDRDCFRDLRVTDPRDDKTRIEQAKGSLLKDSYIWIIDNNDFKQWRNNGQGLLLWIKGDPGKGKTMLLCGIINELSASTKLTDPEASTLLSYFFCEAADSRINSASAVLRGLIYMLVDQQPSLISHVRKKYDTTGKQLFEDVNAWVALSGIFTNILKDPSLQSTYLIIDALDECTTDVSLLLDLVQNSAAYSNVKWIVSSRNWPSIEKALNKATQKVRLCLELNEKSVSAAVAAYVQFKVDWLAQRNGYDNDTRNAVRHYLSLNATGTFLWVALVCQELADISGWKAEEKLTTFPPGLDALYKRMMDQIRNSTDAKLSKSILAVVSVVYRPITLDEVTSFVDMPPRSSGNYKVLAEIIGLCGSFLTLRERTISFVHQSAKDFILEKASNDVFHSGIKDTHRTIFSRSLQVMSRTLRRDIYSLGAPGFRIDQVEQPDPDPLAAARYSCVYWVDHLHDSDPTTNAINDLQDGGSVDKFLRRSYLHWLEALSLLRSMSEGIASMLRLKAMENDWTACLQTLEGHGGWVNSVAWSYDATRLASASNDTTIKIWDPVTGQCVSTIEGHSRLVNSVAWSHDATRLASASDDRTIKIWDPATGQCVSTLEGHGHGVMSVTWSHDATRLASASYDKIIKIWDPATGQCVSTLEGHGDWVNFVTWSYDATRLASASYDKIIKIWDPPTGQCVSTLEGHGDWVKFVTWSHDATRLASASYDKTIKIWDPETGQCVSTFAIDQVLSYLYFDKSNSDHLHTELGTFDQRHLDYM